MKYNNNCNINVVSIGEKLEDYLVENIGRYLDESDEGTKVDLSIATSDCHYTLKFDDKTVIGLPKHIFNSREQSYIEGVITRQPLKYMLGCKVKEEGVQ